MVCRENDSPVLETSDLALSFQTGKGEDGNALKNINVSARRAAVTGFVGPDGAGKTTLLRLGAGLLEPSSGQIRVLGVDAYAKPFEIRSRIGYMPQQFGLYEDLTVRENLDLYADLQTVPYNQRPEQYRSLLEMTDLGDFTDRLAGRLSGGMKQKLGLACCLVKSPEMLILDEPTVGVDPVSRRELWKIIYQLVKENGIGVVLSTAYLDEAERCDYVYLLHQGKILGEGNPADFRNRMRGRVRSVTPTNQSQVRELQARLAGHESVLDATIRSGNVRVVLTADAGDFNPDANLSSKCEVVDPVFEDAFIDQLVKKEAMHSNGMDQPIRAPDQPEKSQTVIEVDGLTKKFGNFEAVRNISFKVSNGEVFGLLGANGAGKTTTFRMLCGLLPLTDGEVRVAGHDLRRSPAEARSRLGYMAQKFSLYQQLTVLHNLRFYGKAYGLKGKKLHQRIDWALEEFDLFPRRNLAAGALPGGYRQRLAMAAALLHEPDILFLDEPTSGADPLARREFWLRINGFARSGVTVVVTTHFMEEAEFCDNLLILSNGAALAHGTPADIRNMARTSDRPEPTIEDAFISLASDPENPVAANNGGIS